MDVKLARNERRRRGAYLALGRDRGDPESERLAELALASTDVRVEQVRLELELVRTMVGREGALSARRRRTGDEGGSEGRAGQVGRVAGKGKGGVRGHCKFRVLGWIEVCEVRFRRVFAVMGSGAVEGPPYILLASYSIHSWGWSRPLDGHRM